MYLKSSSYDIQSLLAISYDPTTYCVVHVLLLVSCSRLAVSTMPTISVHVMLLVKPLPAIPLFSPVEVENLNEGGCAFDPENAKGFK